MTYRIFISSVQRAFAKERMALADYIRKDMLFGMFLDIFLFERTAAQGRDIDFTQKDEVGEVGCTKWVKSSGRVGVGWEVESNANPPVKSRVNGGSSRLYPLRSMGWCHWVKSGVLYETERAA